MVRILGVKTPAKVPNWPDGGEVSCADGLDMGAVYLGCVDLDCVEKNKEQTIGIIGEVKGKVNCIAASQGNRILNPQCNILVAGMASYEKLHISYNGQS